MRRLDELLMGDLMRVADRKLCDRPRIRQRSYSTTTSSGNRKVVAPSSNCTNNIRRPKLSTERRMRGFSLYLLRPSWSRTGLSKRARLSNYRL